MSWLVVWFSGGRLRNAKVCRSQRTLTRTANRFNEYAQLYNKLKKESHLVGIIKDVDLIDPMKVHDGVTKHQSPAKLKAKRDLREFMDLPTKGGVQ